MVQVPADGYIAVIKPFFADAWMPEQRGLASSIPFDSTSSNTHIVTRTNGKTPRYFCVRLSYDGESVTQLCDPNAEVNGVNRTTGVVRVPPSVGKPHQREASLPPYLP